MTKEVVILAGGFGSRLKSAVPDLPKCMAPVAGRPFIDFIIMELLNQKVEKFIFALGYMHEIVLGHLEVNWTDLNYCYCIENTPLGTGGAIKLASNKVDGDHFLVVNGDTLFKLDLLKMSDQHIRLHAFITIGIKEMLDFERYGSVILDDSQTIISFKEKTFMAKGLINGGTYIIDKVWFHQLPLPDVFSFEKEILEVHLKDGHIKGFVADGYFIDIGIPQDFKKASVDLVNSF